MRFPNVFINTNDVQKSCWDKADPGLWVRVNTSRWVHVNNQALCCQRIQTHTPLLRRLAAERPTKPSPPTLPWAGLTSPSAGRRPPPSGTGHRCWRPTPANELWSWGPCWSHTWWRPPGEGGGEGAVRIGGTGGRPRTWRQWSQYLTTQPYTWRIRVTVSRSG